MKRIINENERLELKLWIKWLKEIKDYNDYNKEEIEYIKSA
jgi:hypothetical protein